VLAMINWWEVPYQLHSYSYCLSYVYVVISVKCISLSHIIVHVQDIWSSVLCPRSQY
jgi:hypothetical protein